MVTVEISVGEYADRVTILQIKAARIAHPLTKRERVFEELTRMLALWPENLDRDLQELAELRTTNEEIWDHNEAMTEIILALDRGRFVLPNSIAFHGVRLKLRNDRRAALKAKIDDIAGDVTMEVKSYP